MITTLNINKLSDINNDFIIKILKDMIINYGEIELIIKPVAEITNKELINRILLVENGEGLLTFENNEFDALNKNLLNGIKQDKEKIKRMKKNEKNNIISK
jgi:predicted RNA-binding protein with RPS1 domain